MFVLVTSVLVIFLLQCFVVRAVSLSLHINIAQPQVVPLLYVRLASGCSLALRSWIRSRSVFSLDCLASGCSIALRSWSRSRCLFSLACIASGCSLALRSWIRSRSVSSLARLASGCSLALRSRLANKLHCLTSVCCDRLRFRSLSCRRCSLAVALSSRCRRNLSLAHSRFTVVEEDGEDSMIIINFSIRICSLHAHV